MALIVSVSGVRGIVGSELTADVVYRFAACFGQYLGGKPVALGRDSRPSGKGFGEAAVAGFRTANCEVRDLGIVPTPTIGFLVRELKCAGGLQITASHNPSPYNGLKMFGPDGAVLSADAGATIKREFEQLTAKLHGQGLQDAVDCSAESKKHFEHVLNCIDIEAIQRRNLSVVLDANGGAGGTLATQFLSRLNCRVVAIGVEPNGDFLHEPEPTPENLRSIEEVVRQDFGSIGCCLDPDADRLVMIDETGHCLSEEWTLALAIQSRLQQSRGPVVINLSTSKVTEDISAVAGVPCYRSAVGEANVVAKMREVNALIGGEGNGGVVDPRIGWVRDPFIGMGLIFEMMAKSEKKLHQLAAELPKYVIKKDKLSLPRAQLEPAFAKLTRQWPDAAIDRQDGLRLSWPDRWIHLRGSNTEPIVRLIAEGKDIEVVDSLISSALRSIERD